MISYGIDNIAKHESIFKNKRIGLITSVTGLSRSFESTISILHKSFGLSALFSPEHGVRGDRDAGEQVDTYMDPTTNVPVYSLYRKDSKRLSEEMLDAVDMVVYDIQDVGARYYTFLYTMLYALEDCAKHGKEFVVLDRPNPLGDVVEGNILKEEFSSFVGGYPLATRYGLTIGEFATMANKACNCKLHVIPCEGYSRDMMFHHFNRPWVMPSLGLPRYESALLYPGTCLFEGTNVSEGRGTTAPFEIIGAPFVRAETLALAMNAKKLSGVVFRPVYFKPLASKHAGEKCQGVQIHILDFEAIRPVRVGIELLFEIKNTCPEFCFLPPVKEGGRSFIDLLMGDDVLTKGISKDEILQRFAKDEAIFKERKEAYHLYGGLN